MPFWKNLAAASSILVLACDVPAEAPATQTENTDRPLRYSDVFPGTSEIQHPRATRYVNKEYQYVCETTCPPQSWQQEVNIDPGPCWQDCGFKAVKVVLSATRAAADAGQPFGAYVYPDPHVYKGCGPQAGQNVAAFYGDHYNIWQAASKVPTWSFWYASDIASTPDGLRDGVKRLLDRGQQVASVRRHSHIGSLRDRVVEQLLQGNPVIVLVNSGNHWVTVTGFQAPNKYHVIDYGHNRWRTDAELGFHGWGAGAFTLGFQGYNPRTIITMSVARDPSRQDLPAADPNPPNACHWVPCGESSAYDPATCSCL